MTTQTIKMPFLLQEELTRITNATDFELFILKCHIENIIYTKRKLEKLASKISIGASLKYFDVELLTQDVLLVNELGELIKGIRQSDQKQVCIQPQSIDCDFKTNVPSINDNRMLISDDWKLPIYHKVVVNSSGNVLKGYFIKYNHNGCKLKLLGGETIKLRPYASFYEPSPEDLQDFIRIEQDQVQQHLEYERTLSALKKNIGQLDPNNYPNDYRKITRLLIGRGFFIDNIDKAIKLLDSNEVTPPLTKEILFE
ncbi:hypothetical protein [Legionella bozemanae]|uniref:Uncharacterized protein n=1 Tax=Legionella bozemanae TaxID=447 RepID=A0A0W0REX9_LEGBO|nr:hypothetical protein [Legionella bozemanae]KTC69541.1 hypothetical protein Lboz_3057 [Legionella bozemanae]STP10062.1 Uncharacterised protein [Legionella bozemanae]